MSLEFRVLGPFEVLAGGRPIRISGRGRRMVLAALVLGAGEVVSLDRLVDALWEDTPPRRAELTIQVYISQIRKTLTGAGDVPGRIETRAPGYLLHVAAEEIDSARFRRLAAEGRAALAAGNPEAASAALREAIALHRGDPLADLACDRWARAELESLRAARLEAIEDRIRADLQLGWHTELLDELESLVGEHPLRERLVAHLMLALYRSGRQADALEACRRARMTLADDLGVDPGPELRDLELAILEQRPSLDLARGPRTAAAAAASGGNLPAPLTTFVGRGDEIRALAKALAHDRLVTLTGPGGCGKTRLAVEAARALAGEYADGAWVAELASLPLASLVPQAVTSALGVRGQPGRPAAGTLVDWLAPRTLLLVLDNCEHVLQASAHLVHTLLEACPELRVVATSRERLGVPGERLQPVPPLEVPGEREVPVEALAACESVRLFVERAKLADSEFRLGADNATHVANICRRLDGLPLAVEIAASRLAGMAVVDVAARLEDRLTLLSTGSRTAPPRQQTLRALIEWSERLLDERDREAFCRLSVLPGRFSIDAARAICRDVPAGDGAARDGTAATLASLATKSLLVPVREQKGTRYEMLETIREYAVERLRATGDEQECLAGLLRYVSDLAGQADACAFGPNEPALLERIDADRAAVRAGLVWGARAAPETALLAVAQLFRYWMLREQATEGRRLLESALGAAEGIDDGLRARALNFGGALALFQDDLAAALPFVSESLEIRRSLDDRPGMAHCLLNLGILRHRLGELDAAEALLRESLEIYRRSGLRAGEAGALHSLGILAFHRGDPAAAVHAEEEALEIYTECGDPAGTAKCFNGLGNIAIEQADYETATAWYERGLASTRASGDVHGVGVALTNLGHVAMQRGDRATARAILEESLEHARAGGMRSKSAIALMNLSSMLVEDGELDAAESFGLEALAIAREAGDQAGIGLAFDALAVVALRRGLAPRSVVLRSAAIALRERIGLGGGQGTVPGDGGDLAEARAALGEQRYRSAWEEGRALSLPEAIRKAAAVPAPASSHLR